MAEKTTPQRPNIGDEAIRSAVADQLLDDVFAWTQREGDDHDRDDVASDLFDAIRPYLDGYGMARHLENRHGWDSDSDLVEILDKVPLLLAKEAEKAIRHWVLDNDIKPPCKVGDAVEWSWPSGPKIKGTVVQIFADEARLIVATTDEVPAGAGGWRTGKLDHRFIIDYERVTPLATEAT